MAQKITENIKVENMNSKQHLTMIIICIAAWFIFLLLGIPSNYYMDYSVIIKVLIIIGTFLFFMPLVTILLLRTFKNTNLLTASLYFSVYATLGIFLLDYLYCGIYLGYGLGFVKSHWPQSSFYILPWFEVPIIGYIMEKRRLNISK